MKVIFLALLGVLAALHWLEGQSATALPLSMFWDGRHAGLGYLAFSLLILMGGVMTFAAYRCGDSITGTFYAVAMILLIAIAATPSFDSFHLFISLLLPFLFYAYYLTLLYSHVSFWMFLHLFVPLIVLLAIHYHSFGAWQKSMIIYFGLVANVHYSFLPAPGRKTVRKQSASESNWDRVERRIAEEGVSTTSRMARPERAADSPPPRSRRRDGRD
jgi:hypothetical protein